MTILHRPWIIRTKRRVWILSGRQVVGRLFILSALGALLLWMLVDLTVQIVRQRNANQELAEAARLDARYRYENAQQVERSKRILTSAEREFTKTIVTSSAAVAKEGKSAGADPGVIVTRVLKEPYPVPAEVAFKLGKPDFQSTGTGGLFMVWNLALWGERAESSASQRGSTPRQQSVQEFMVVRFDGIGRLEELVITERGAEGSVLTRHVGRQPKS